MITFLGWRFPSWCDQNDDIGITEVRTSRGLDECITFVLQYTHLVCAENYTEVHDTLHEEVRGAKKSRDW